jgi:hypothetical protein
MEWSDLVLILRDIFDNAAMWCGMAACAIFAGAAAGFAASPQQRARYDDEAGDTHTSWELHRAEIQPARWDGSETPARAPNPRVRAISSVQAARDAKLHPSYDGHRANHHQV